MGTSGPTRSLETVSFESQKVSTPTRRRWSERDRFRVFSVRLNDLDVRSTFPQNV